MGVCGLLVIQETENPTELANCAIIKKERKEKKNNKKEIIMKIITMWCLARPTHGNVVNLINDYLIML